MVNPKLDLVSENEIKNKVRDTLLKEDYVPYIKIPKTEDYEMLNDPRFREYDYDKREKLEGLLLGKFKTPRRDPFDCLDKILVLRYAILVNSIKEDLDKTEEDKILWEVVSKFEEERQVKTKRIYIIHSSEEFQMKEYIDTILSSSDMEYYAFVFDMAIASKYIIEDEYGFRFPSIEDYEKLRKFLENRSLTRWNVKEFKDKAAFLPKKRTFK